MRKFALALLVQAQRIEREAPLERVPDDALDRLKAEAERALETPRERSDADQLDDLAERITGGAA